jgi:hypothetical protein
MQSNEISDTIVLVKNFIEKNDNTQQLFDQLALKLYNLHFYNNKKYKDICNVDLPKSWEELPLLNSNILNQNFEEYFGVQITTEMPFPGIKLFSKDEKLVHYIRDTELYKKAIAKSFQLNVLKEMNWVPWINFQSVGDWLQNNLTSVDYALAYLAESFHGNRHVIVDQNYEILLSFLREEYGEENPITIPTVLVTNENSLNYISACFYEQKIELPLGSNVILITNQPKPIDVDLLQNTCNAFGLTQIMIMLCLPEISTPIYATIKQTNINSVIKNNSIIEPEYFVQNWMKAKIIETDVNIEKVPGQIGKIAIYDLANAWSCPFILTDYYGKIGPKGGIVFTEKNTL